MQEDDIVQEGINNCINYSRKLVKQIDHAKRVNDGLEDIKTLVFAAMVSYYGIEKLNEVAKELYVHGFNKLFYYKYNKVYNNLNDRRIYRAFKRNKQGRNK